MMHNLKRQYLKKMALFSLIVLTIFLIAGCDSSKQINNEFFELTESNEVGVHHADRAFDNSIQPDNFWESLKFPIWLQIGFRGDVSRSVRKYMFQSGEDATRMPQNWQLQGSDDEKSWTVLDEQSNQIKWKVNEDRTYRIANPKIFRYFRFYFTKGNNPDILRIYEIKLFE